ncbi:MAG: CoA-binding protein [Planctomycetes bacterium]|nr:CoA-binding protein [Planctomycetota bacterium]
MELADNDSIRRLLESARRIAVVGASPKPERDSHDVTKYLIEAGYEVFPVNPGQTLILGRPCTAAIPAGMDIVDVFRSPEHVPGVVEEAIRAGAKCVWMQLGTSNPDAVRRAAEAGLDVVADKCIKVAHGVLKIAKR